MQAVSSGDVASIAQARDVIRRSFDVEEYTPDNPRPWHDAYGRFAQLAS